MPIINTAAILGEKEEESLKPLPSPSNARIKDVLQEIGIDPTEKKELGTLLDKHGLDTDGLLQELRYILDSKESSHVKLRAIEMGLKMSGALKDIGQAPPNVTIVIHDTAKVEVNPIIIPRGMQIESSAA